MNSVFLGPPSTFLHDILKFPLYFSQGVCYTPPPMDTPVPYVDSAVANSPDYEEPPYDPLQGYPGLEQVLSAEAKATRGFHADRKVKKQLAYFSKAMEEAFHIVGGVPRLVLWADANYEEFIKLKAKLFPSTVTLSQINIHGNGPVQIVTAIPPSALDDPHETHVVPR